MDLVVVEQSEQQNETAGIVHKQINGALQASSSAPLYDGAQRNQYDAAGALACTRWRSAVTRCYDIGMPPYDQ